MATTTRRADIAWRLAFVRRCMMDADRRVRALDPFATAQAVAAAQDAAELLLLAMAPGLRLNVGDKETFATLLQKTAEKSTVVAKYRANFEALNRLRVSAKHAGLRPDRAQGSALVVTSIAAMYEIAAAPPLRTNLRRVGLASWLKNKLVAEALVSAERCLRQKWTSDRAEECRMHLALGYHFAKQQGLDGGREALGIRKRDSRFLRRDRGRSYPGSDDVDRLGSYTDEQLGKLQDAVISLATGIPPQHLARLDAELPTIATTETGEIYTGLGGRDSLQRETALGLFEVTLELAERADGVVPRVRDELARRAIRDAEIWFGEGEHRRFIGNLEIGRLYEVRRAAAGHASIQTFGVRGTVDRDALEPLT